MTRHVLKEDRVMMVSDEMGDMPRGRRRLGLYCCDTRFLSVMETTIGGQQPRLLASSSELNYVCEVQMANPTMTLPDGTSALARTISIKRSRFLKGGLHERVSFYNHNPFPVTVEFAVVFGSDFRDVLEVRGWERERRGEIKPPSFTETGLCLSYAGLDGVERRTEVIFEAEPASVEIDICAPEPLLKRPSTFLPDAVEPAVMTVLRPACAKVTWHLCLMPGEPHCVAFHIIPVEDDGPVVTVSFDQDLEELRRSYREWESECVTLETDNEMVNQLLRRSLLDLRLLMDRTPQGLVPTAGIPWFACIFGRDSIITSLQTLMLNPQIAVSTLRYMAAHQGTKVDPWRDEEPGKIIHEMRKGETARAGETPHSAYYGSVDATPLFVILFAETMKWLDDDDLYRELLPAAKRALRWMEEYGDLYGDGYVEYLSRSERGSTHQGWKDIHLAITHADGTAVEPPVALVEVQGYAYRAMREMALLLRRKGERALPARLEKKAAALKERFNRDFWLENKRMFAQALDAQRRPVEVLTSNPGHCLLCDIVDEDKARYVVLRLSSADMASGWGVRTVSNREAKYNPMSYQNGSIWPHDNSIIVAGMKHYGYTWEAEHIATQLFDASRHFSDARFPQLYCGFPRDRDGFAVPAAYPVSPSPQAWTAGSAILLFQSLLGLRADAHARRIYVTPKLPPWVGHASIRNLRVGKGTVDLYFERHEEDTSFKIAENEADVEVVLPPP